MLRKQVHLLPWNLSSFTLPSSSLSCSSLAVLPSVLSPSALLFPVLFVLGCSAFCSVSLCPPLPCPVRPWLFCLLFCLPLPSSSLSCSSLAVLPSVLSPSTLLFPVLFVLGCSAFCSVSLYPPLPCPVRPGLFCLLFCLPLPSSSLSCSSLAVLPSVLSPSTLLFPVLFLLGCSAFCSVSLCPPLPCPVSPWLSCLLFCLPLPSSSLSCFSLAVLPSVLSPSTLLFPVLFLLGCPAFCSVSLYPRLSCSVPPWLFCLLLFYISLCVLLYWRIHLHFWGETSSTNTITSSGNVST